MTDFTQYTQTSGRDTNAFLNMLRKLLPKGKLWGFFTGSTDDILYDSSTVTDEIIDDPSTSDELIDTNVSSSDTSAGWLGRLMSVVANELNRFDVRSYELVTEYIPGLADETLEELRKEYVREELEGPLILDDDDLRALVHSKKYDVREIINAAQIVSICATLGFTVNVVEDSDSSSLVAVCGVAICGDAVCGDQGIYSTLIIEVLAGTASYDLMVAYVNDLLPAHVNAVWDDQR